MFNGPPRSGKDTVSEYLNENLEDSEIIKFTKPIKDLTHKSLGLNVKHNHFELDKDNILKDFNNRTPRQSYIQTSENLRSEKGQYAVADLFTQEVLKSKKNIIINPDIGYDFELEYVLSKINPDNCILIQIRREGYTFKDDCRDWISDKVINCEKYIVDNSSKEKFLEKVFLIINNFLQEKYNQYKNEYK
jgi:hypothetical protein